MIRLKLDKILYDQRINMNQLSEMTGIRFATISDMVKNNSKHWSVDNLNKIISALKIKDVGDLFDICPEENDQ